jgi:hypothetical protein
MSTYIYGKIFASMFEGSLIGSGSHVFAVMAYVISHMQPASSGEEYVRLHPQLLATAIGEKEADMAKAIAFLCKKDAATTTEAEEGRRLVLESPYLYRVVNGKYYRGLMNEEDRRTKAAIRQKRFRDKKAGKSLPLAGETTYVKGLENGTITEDGEPIRSPVGELPVRQEVPELPEPPPMIVKPFRETA